MSEIGYGISLASLILAVLIMLVSRYVAGVLGHIFPDAKSYRHSHREVNVFAITCTQHCG